MLYINKYETSGDVQTAIDNETLLKPYVALVGSGSNAYVDYNSLDKFKPYAEQYCTVVMLGAGGFSINGDVTCYWSVDNGSTWNAGGEVTGLSEGDKVLLKANIEKFDSSDALIKSFTANYNLQGNIMSLIFGDAFSAHTEFIASDAKLKGLFNSNISLISAEHLILPAQTLPEYIYCEMFKGCSNMTTAPELPASTLSNYCYDHMYADCGSLSYIKCLATNIAAEGCISHFTDSVSPSGTFVKAASMNDWPIADSDGSGIPENWTIENA